MSASARNAAQNTAQQRQPHGDQEPGQQGQQDGKAGTKTEASAPLIGVDDLEPPKWASVDEQVASASMSSCTREVSSSRAPTKNSWQRKACITNCS